MTSEDRNDLAWWFPRIEAKDLPVPRTKIVTTELDLTPLLDGQKPDGFDAFLDELMWAGNEVGGRPFFLRTGHGSGKHEWVDTCYVDENHLGWHVAALVEWSHTVDMFGLPTSTWVARELLLTRHAFHAFKGMPIVREFRVFIRDDEIELIQPYWPPDSITNPDDPYC